MKLRFKSDSLRLRLNRSEVRRLAAGEILEERVHFPDALFTYLLQTGAHTTARFEAGTISITVAADQAKTWDASEEIGIYFQNGPLSVMIEKDLECLDGPESERDPDAYPRKIC